jgi:hypothetical protein
MSESVIPVGPPCGLAGPSWRPTQMRSGASMHGHRLAARRQVTAGLAWAMGVAFTGCGKDESTGPTTGSIAVITTTTREQPGPGRLHGLGGRRGLPGHRDQRNSDHLGGERREPQRGTGRGRGKLYRRGPPPADGQRSRRRQEPGRVSGPLFHPAPRDDRVRDQSDGRLRGLQDERGRYQPRQSYEQRCQRHRARLVA